MKIEIMIFGRCRRKFQKLFPKAKFEGYECNIRNCWFSLTGTPIRKVISICLENKIHYYIQRAV